MRSPLSCFLGQSLAWQRPALVKVVETGQELTTLRHSDPNAREIVDLGPSQGPDRQSVDQPPWLTMGALDLSLQSVTGSFNVCKKWNSPHMAEMKELE